MARDAIAAGRSARELAFVHVLMAIGAFFVRDGLFEIGALMTLEAAGFGVFSVERKLGLVMVESGVGSHGFPGGRHVAGLAGAPEGRIHESAAMRIGVAILTAGKAQALIAGSSTARRGRMALHTIDALMAPGQGIRCTAVIEARSRLPGVLRMAVRAFVAELPAVLILMATDTFRGQPEECVANILDLYLGPNGGPYVLRIMAVFARQRLVFTGQRKVCQGVMFEPWPVEFGDLKLAAVVFEVTAGAIRLAA